MRFESRGVSLVQSCVSLTEEWVLYAKNSKTQEKMIKQTHVVQRKKKMWRGFVKISTFFRVSPQTNIYPCTPVLWFFQDQSEAHHTHWMTTSHRENQVHIPKCSKSLKNNEMTYSICLEKTMHIVQMLNFPQDSPRDMKKNCKCL